MNPDDKSQHLYFYYSHSRSIVIGQVGRRMDGCINMEHLFREYKRWEATINIDAWIKLIENCSSVVPLDSRKKLFSKIKK